MDLDGVSTEEESLDGFKYPGQFYLLSKDCGDDPHLIGVLKRLGRSEYSFQYLIKADKFPEWFMWLDGFDEIGKVYESEEAKALIHWVVPRPEKLPAMWFQKTYDVPVYDEWLLLCKIADFHNKTNKWDNYPISDSHERIYFNEEVPRGANRYN
jgi:hypothetical protein